MQFVNEELLVKINNLPFDRREKVIDGFIKMLAERPKGYSKELQITDNPERIEVQVGLPV